MLPGVLSVADAHYREMQRLGATAVRLVRRAWNRIDVDNMAASWGTEAARVLAVFTGLQLEAATAGAGYSGDTLNAQGIRAEPEATFLPESLAGLASDGRPLESLLRTPLDVVTDRLEAGLAPAEALESGRVSIERIAQTQIADAGRVAAGVDIATRPGVGWVRMLNPPSCSRCVVLAGKFYRWNDGFDRHPQDDCVHVATSAVAARREGLVDDPNEYFRSLSREDQDRIFTKAGAKAIRDGADIGQVVNARRGMSTAGRDLFGNRVGRLAPTRVFGQDVFTTLEGTTRRGLAGKRLIAEGARLAGESAESVLRLSRTGPVSRTVTRQRVQIPRLMPESIYELATDRADALRLLRRNGYILESPGRTLRRSTPPVPKAGQAALDAAPMSITSDKLAFDARSQLREYKGVSYTPTNMYLRKGSGSFLRETVEGLDSVLDQSRLTTDAIVWRGVKTPRAVLGARFDGDLTGMEWIEHAYLSTSADRRVAEGFAEGGGLVMRMVAPKGSPMIRMSDLAPEGVAPGPLHEAELLGGRGWRLRVAADHGVDAQGRRVVDVEVVSHDRSGVDPWNRA